MFVQGRLDCANNVEEQLIPDDNSAGHRVTNAVLQASHENSSYVVVGGPGLVASPVGSVTGVRLYAGNTEHLTVTDLADVIVRAPIAGQSVTWHAKAI